MRIPEQIPLCTRHTATPQMHRHHSHPHPGFRSHNLTRYVAHQLEYSGLINKKQLKLHLLFNLYLLLPFLYPTSVNWGAQQEATFEVARASWRGDGKPWPPEHHRRNTGTRPGAQTVQPEGPGGKATTHSSSACKTLRTAAFIVFFFFCFNNKKGKPKPSIIYKLCFAIYIIYKI